MTNDKTQYTTNRRMLAGGFGRNRHSPDRARNDHRECRSVDAADRLYGVLRPDDEGDPMKARIYKDEDGFWMAHIQEQPASSGSDAVFVRQLIPVPPSASAAQAAEALARLIDRRNHVR